jgi:high-affinity nickel-transport protein
MSLAVAGVSLLVAAFGVAKMTLPAVDAWSDGRELAFGAIVVAVITSSYLLARALVPPPLRATSGE